MRVLAFEAAIRLDSAHGVGKVASDIAGDVAVGAGSPIFAAPVLGRRTFGLVLQGSPRTMKYGDP